MVLIAEVLQNILIIIQEQHIQPVKSLQYVSPLMGSSRVAVKINKNNTLSKFQIQLKL